VSESLTPEEERACLRLARQALEHYFRTGKHLRSPIGSGTLKEKRGAFVTLTVDGDLRGCVGYPLPVKPLDETIIEMAVAAASQDTRFEPLAANELKKLKIEISVLGLPKPAGGPTSPVGCHGIIVSKGFTGPPPAPGPRRAQLGQGNLPQPRLSQGGSPARRVEGGGGNRGLHRPGLFRIARLSRRPISSSS
jgi:hypothetical protein